MRRSNILLDERSEEALEKFPRTVSMSAILRCLLKAATTNEDEWKELLKEDTDLNKARNVILDYLKSTGRKHIAI